VTSVPAAKLRGYALLLAALVWGAIESACAEGTACLVATHDEAASAHADRLWRIEDGRIVD